MSSYNARISVKSVEQHRWLSATKHYNFLRKLYWYVDDTPVMKRDWCELGSLRSFFGNDHQRDICNALIESDSRLTRERLRDGLAELYQIPSWAIDSFDALGLKGPWVAKQGLPKLLRLIACHTRATAPRTAIALNLLVEIEDELAPPIFQGQHQYDANTLKVLAAIYQTESLEPYRLGRERLCAELIAWANSHGCNPPSLSKFYGSESLGEWLQLLHRKGSASEDARPMLCTYANARLHSWESGTELVDDDGFQCIVTIGFGLIQITDIHRPHVAYVGRELSSGLFELKGFLDETTLSLTCLPSPNRLVGWENGGSKRNNLQILLGKKTVKADARLYQSKRADMSKKQ